MREYSARSANADCLLLWFGTRLRLCQRLAGDDATAARAWLVALLFQWWSRDRPGLHCDDGGAASCATSSTQSHFIRARDCDGSVVRCDCRGVLVFSAGNGVSH